MSNLVILVWKNREGSGEPEAEVRIPTNLVKWIPRMMRLIPKKTKDETWGGDVDFDAMFTDIDKLVQEASTAESPELMTVKSKDAFVRMKVEK